MAQPTASVEVKLREASEKEVALRRERAQIPYQIAKASQVVENLRGQGLRDGYSEELDRAVGQLRELQSRQQALDALIVDAIAARCRCEADRLGSEEQHLRTERDALRMDAHEAWNTVRLARRDALELSARLEAIDTRMGAKGTEAMNYETFAQRAAEFSGQPQKTRKLLEEAFTQGLLLPMEAPLLVEASLENGSRE